MNYICQFSMNFSILYWTIFKGRDSILWYLTTWTPNYTIFPNPAQFLLADVPWQIF